MQIQGAADVTMAQASSAQREPSMEEILASIRRIIEDNDAGRRQATEPEPARPAAAERTVIEVDAFRNELRTPPLEAAERTPAPRETPKKPTLADIQAQINLVGSERDTVVASYAIISAIGALTAERLGLAVEIFRPQEHYDAVKNKWGGVRTPDGR